MPPPAIMPMLLSPSPSETESEPETDDPTLLLAAGAQSRLRRRPAVAVHARLLPDSSAPGTALFCGSEYDADDWWDARRPTSVPFLPLPLDGDPRRTPLQSRAPRASTGCGARVHASAHAARGGGRWVGYVEGVEPTVVRLDSEYFAEIDRSSLGLNVAGCECAVNGIGCAVCGNALGALHTHCRVHQPRKGQAHYVFLPGAVSPPIKDAADSSQPTASTSVSTSTSTSTSTSAPIPTDENTPPPLADLGPAPPWARERPATWFERLHLHQGPESWSPDRPRPPTREEFGPEQLAEGVGRGEGPLIWQPQRSSGTPLSPGDTFPRPRTPPTRAESRTAEVARIEAQLAASFLEAAHAAGTGNGTGTESRTLVGDAAEVAFRRLVGRLRTPPTVATTTTTAPETVPEEGEVVDPERMEVDDPANLMPVPLPATPQDEPPPLVVIDAAESVRQEPEIETVQSDPAELDSWLTEPLFVADSQMTDDPEPELTASDPMALLAQAQQLEPIVFSTPPTERVPLPPTENVNPPEAREDDAAETQAARERIALAAMLLAHAQRWESPPTDFPQAQASTSSLPPPPSLTRAAPTSTTPTRGLRRTSARADLFNHNHLHRDASATSRAQLVGRRNTRTPTTPSISSTTPTPPPPVRFPSVREQEAWLAAEAGAARRPLRRASVPDLRRRASAGVGAGESVIIRRVGRLRRAQVEVEVEPPAAASTAIPMDVDGDSDGGETVRAGVAGQPVTPPHPSASGPPAVAEAPHIARARERILTRERYRADMMRFMGGTQRNVIDYTDVSRPASAGVREAPNPPRVVRRRTWFER